MNKNIYVADEFNADFWDAKLAAKKTGVGIGEYFIKLHRKLKPKTERTAEEIADEIKLLTAELAGKAGKAVF